MKLKNLPLLPMQAVFTALSMITGCVCLIPAMNMIYISEQSKKDDDELAAKHKKKVANDEEFK